MTESIAPPRERLPSSLFSPARAEELLQGAERDRLQRPEQLVGALRIQPGDRVADIGAGVGYLTPFLSRAVGSTGRVISEEIQREFLPELDRFRRLGNVEVVLGAPDDPRLPGPPMDCFILLTVYHEVRNPIQFLRTLRRYAHAETRLAIVDFDPDVSSSTPPPIGHSVPERAVRSEAAAAGWRLERQERAYPGQYFLIFRPSTQLERALPQRPPRHKRRTPAARDRMTSARNDVGARVRSGLRLHLTSGLVYASTVPEYAEPSSPMSRFGHASRPTGKRTFSTLKSP